MLSEAGSPYRAADLKALVSGVLAAPEDQNPDAWMAVIAENLSEPLKAELRALKANLAGDAKPRGLALGDRLPALRQALAEAGLDGFVVPHSDAQQNEYLPAYAERLAWLTGFTGSAGTAVVLAEKAAIFVDGRYTLQVRDEVDGSQFYYGHVTEEPPQRWIGENLPAGGKLGL